MSVTEGGFIERRGNSHKLIQELVDVRTEMLSLYSELAAKHPFDEDAAVHGVLDEFCQILIDYTADSHFRLYRFIDERKERRVKLIEVADQLYPRIVSTTQSILDFNDKYDAQNESKSLNELGDDLSVLGERIADRIDMEDEVIQVLGVNRKLN